MRKREVDMKDERENRSLVELFVGEETLSFLFSLFSSSFFFLVAFLSFFLSFFSPSTPIPPGDLHKRHVSASMTPLEVESKTTGWGWEKRVLAFSYERRGPSFRVRFQENGFFCRDR